MLGSLKNLEQVGLVFGPWIRLGASNVHIQSSQALMPSFFMECPSSQSSPLECLSQF